MMQKDQGLERDIRHWESMLRGDEQAFASIYEDYFKVLYNYGRKICSDSSRVEDAIHDLFVDLWRFRSNLSPTTSVRFYLYRSLRRRLVRNDSNGWFTDEGILIEDALQWSSPAPETEIIETETKDHRLHQLKKLLNDLSPRQYEALVLFFYDEFSYQEVASIMNVNEQSARNLVQRGLIQLRQYARHIISLLFFFLSGF